MYLCNPLIYKFTKCWYAYLVAQQHFELKLTMPPTDRGGRGYTDKYVAKVTKELHLQTK
jgi:hypothetical protein